VVVCESDRNLLISICDVHIALFLQTESSEV
jgi:hypothetical protein